MRQAPSFWWRREQSPLARALQPVGAIVGAIAARRMARKGADPGAPVICIGNFVAGGAGKTPVAMAIAELLFRWGETPFLLTRGYGAVAGAAPVRVDRAIHSVAEVGDEALLLAGVAPTIVAVDRSQSAELALHSGASVLVMDDGLQSRRLEPDLAIAVVDGAVGTGNGACLPAGPLRAPLAAQLCHVDAVLVLGAGRAGEDVAALAREKGSAVLRGDLVPEEAAVLRLRQGPVLAFAGIGRPEKFFATLRQAGIVVAETAEFADHHMFSKAELAALGARAEKASLTLVTTQKDVVRLPPGEGIEVLPVGLRLGEPADLERMIRAALARRRCRPG